MYEDWKLDDVEGKDKVGCKDDILLMI